MQCVMYSIASLTPGPGCADTVVNWSRFQIKSAFLNVFAASSNARKAIDKPNHALPV